MDTRTPTGAVGRAVTAVVALAMVATACSGGDAEADGVATLEQDAEVAITDSTDDQPTDDGTPSDSDTETQMLEFAACMRDEGVDIGDPVVDADGNVTFGNLAPGAGGGGGRPEGLREGFDACGDLLDGVQLGGRGGPGGDVDQTERQDAQLEFTQCLRDEGVDVDDPDFSEPGQPGEGDGPRGPLQDLDRSDPAVEAAMDACGDLLTGFGPGGGPGGAPPAGDES